MERLTKKYKDGHIGINCDEKSCMEEGSCPEVEGCKFLKQILSKLSAYENTDLVPKQFVELDKMYLEKCEEVNQLNAKLEKAEPYIKLAEKMNLCDLVAENQRLTNELIFVNAELRECKESLKRLESEQNEKFD